MDFQNVSFGATQYVGKVDLKKAEKMPKVNLDDPVDTAEFSTKAATKSEKKPVSAIASFFVPGLGQLINGDQKSAVKYFGRHVGTGILIGVGAATAALGSTLALSVVGYTVAATACIGQVVNGIQGIVNAYNNK